MFENSFNPQLQNNNCKTTVATTIAMLQLQHDSCNKNFKTTTSAKQHLQQQLQSNNCKTRFATTTAQQQLHKYLHSNMTRNQWISKVSNAICDNIMIMENRAVCWIVYAKFAHLRCSARHCTVSETAYCLTAKVHIKFQLSYRSLLLYANRNCVWDILTCHLMWCELSCDDSLAALGS